MHERPQNLEIFFSFFPCIISLAELFIFHYCPLFSIGLAHRFVKIIILHRVLTNFPWMSLFSFSPAPLFVCLVKKFVLRFAIVRLRSNFHGWLIFITELIWEYHDWTISNIWIRNQNWLNKFWIGSFLYTFWF